MSVPIANTVTLFYRALPQYIHWQYLIDGKENLAMTVVNSKVEVTERDKIKDGNMIDGHTYRHHFSHY